MPALHAPTLNLVGIVVTLVATGISLIAWYNHRGSPGLRGWALALLLGSAGTLLFRFILLGDALFVAGFATMWMSMRRFNDPTVGAELMAVIVAAITLVFAALFTMAWQVAPVARAQSIVFSLFVFILALLAAWETWRGGRLDGLRSRPIAAFALAGIAIARLARAVMVFLQGLGLVDASTTAIAQGYAHYFTTVFILVVTFGLVLMANERFEREYAMSVGGTGTAE
jgi:hypothetical protein